MIRYSFVRALIIFINKYIRDQNTLKIGYIVSKLQYPRLTIK